MDEDEDEQPRARPADNPTRFRVSNEFATVDVELREVPWGLVLHLTDARTGLSIDLDALEVEALTGLDADERRELVYRSGGPLRRDPNHRLRRLT